MTVNKWLPAPVGIDASRWISRSDCKTVLVVVHTIAGCHRLLDVVQYIEDDPRLQLIFTVAPDPFNNMVAEMLQELDALVLPWHQATRETFDLALAAGTDGLHELHAPLLMMADCAGRGRVVAVPHDGRTAGTPIVCGLDSQQLIHNGRLLPAALVLSHESDLEVLKRQCPMALNAAIVAGDPCFDRLVTGLSRRGNYRRRLSLLDFQDLLVVSSTWGTDGLFGHSPDLLPVLMDQLSQQDIRVAALLHPAIWSAHGRRQVKAWLRDCLDAGLILLDPVDDWRPLVIAADFVLGDHGSVTAYAASVGKPILRLRQDIPTVTTPGSAQDLVTAGATRLDLDWPILPQLRGAHAVDAASIVRALTSRPNMAEMLLRSTMYRLLRLSEADRPTAGTGGST
jgi:hypothetical protein